MEHVAPGSCGGTIYQRIQELTGQILKQYVHLQLTNVIVHQQYK